ncbi:MAG: universal stress protein [Desulfobacterales bacterium]|jgi:ACR3 family arsenite efflux pump ArsB/nucleotide-binding universal stress UspA family protein
MWKLLTLLQKHLVWAIPISMGIGLLFGAVSNAAPLKQFIIPVTFIMVYPMMATLNVKSVFKGSDAKLQLTTQVINFILIPLLAYFTGWLFFSGGPEKYGLWAVGLFLIGVLPTSGMTISWTGFAKGNKEAAIKMVVFGLVLGALAAPVYTKVFMGATIEVDMLHMFRQIALFVFVPLAAGLATQFAVKKRFGETVWERKVKPKFPPFSALGVVLIAFVAMSLKAKNIIASPGDILTILAPLAFFYLISYGLLSLAGRLFFPRGDAIAMVFGVVMRDLSIALAIAMTAFGKQGLTIALLIALAYVIQIQSAAWYVRLVEKIFGKAPDAAPEGADATIERLPVALPSDQEPLIPAIRKILYATDLSETARHAVRYACSIGNRYDAEVTVLHVIPDIVEELSAEVGTDVGGHMAPNERKQMNLQGIQIARDALLERIHETSRRIKKKIPQCPIVADKARVEIGNPAEKIAAMAGEGNFDLVIMGTHGHGKLQEAIVGSVAREVIRKSPVPVMVVRLPEDRVRHGDNRPHAAEPIGEETRKSAVGT